MLAMISYSPLPPVPEAPALVFPPPLVGGLVFALAAVPAFAVA